jgi:hypothetical protein
MRTRTISRVTGHFGFAIAALLSMLAATDAQATVVTTADVAANPGASFGVTFNFDFGSGGTMVSSFAYELDFDPTLLTFTGESVAGQFTPFGTDAALNEPNFANACPPAPSLSGTCPYLTDTSNPGVVSALWQGGFDESFNPVLLDLSGVTSVTYLFDLSAGAVGGTNSSITATIDSYSDATFTPYPDAPVGATATLDITAPTTTVPEPSPVSLMLAGLGLVGVGLLLRRRKARKS